MAVLQERYFLQVGFKIPIGGPHGERAIMPKGGCLAAVCTFSHRTRSFLVMIPNAHPVFWQEECLHLRAERTSAPSAGTALYHKNMSNINGILLAEVQFDNSF